MTALKFIGGFLALPLAVSLVIFINWAFEDGPDWLAKLLAVCLLGIPGIAVCILFGLLAAGLI